MRGDIAPLHNSQWQLAIANYKNDETKTYVDMLHFDAYCIVQIE